jgi:energy-coupling factor transport system ATP-binding protein
VLAIAEGRVVLDAAPAEFLDWASERGSVLVTPAARLFSLAGIGPPPVSVKEARARLQGAGLTPAPGIEAPSPPKRARTRPVLEFDGVWHELADGPAILRGIDLELRAGELVALMGRNGAGKSTLLRHAKRLVEPTRGRIVRGGDVALLLQNPGDFLIHEHVGDEAGAAAIERAGLAGREADHPRDLSGGERQRLALEIVLEADDVAVVCLDEPTRGMDRAWKEALGSRLRELAARGLAVVVATHDTEFAAGWAERIVLMGPGTVIADGSASSVLAGGRHFATDVARILDGAGGALTPEAGARLLERELVR